MSRFSDRKTIITVEIFATSFRAKQNHSRQQGDHDNFKRSESARVSEIVAECEFDGIRGSCKQNADLISKTRHEPSRVVRREFVEVCGDYAPRALHTHLHEKGAH